MLRQLLVCPALSALERLVRQAKAQATRRKIHALAAPQSSPLTPPPSSAVRSAELFAPSVPDCRIPKGRFEMSDRPLPSSFDGNECVIPLPSSPKLCPPSVARTSNLSLAPITDPVSVQRLLQRETTSEGGSAAQGRAPYSTRMYPDRGCLHERLPSHASW